MVGYLGRRLSPILFLAAAEPAPCEAVDCRENSECHERSYARQISRIPRCETTGDLIRILPAKDWGDGEEPVGDDQSPGTARTELRLGDLRRRWIDPRAHPLHHHPHPR